MHDIVSPEIACSVSDAFFHAKDKQTFMAIFLTLFFLTSYACLSHAQKLIELKLNPANTQQLHVILSKAAFKRDFLYHPTWAKPPSEFPRSSSWQLRSSLLKFKLESNQIKLEYSSAQDHHFFPILHSLPDAYVLDASAFVRAGFTFPYVNLPLQFSYYEIDQHLSRTFDKNLNIIANYQTASIAHGIIELPEKVMPSRVLHERIGYFTSDKLNPGLSTSAKTAIARHDLQLHPNNTLKTPIRYFIDPSIPLRFRQTVKEAVESWNEAFENIGFPRAIQAILPSDSLFPNEFDAADLRYNKIVYQVSDTLIAGMATPVIDPRSGQILSSNIVLTNILAKVQASRVAKRVQMQAPNAHACQQNTIQVQNLLQAKTVLQQTSLDFEYVLQAVRSVAAHEVGHSLGLRHNFGGSLAYSKDELLDPAFTFQHGLSSSIMDYLPLNIWSETKVDKITPSQVFHTQIGSYDKVAIAYGYTIFPEEKQGNISAQLTEIALQAPTFYTDDDSSFNPYAATYDLSKDPITFAQEQLEFLHQDDREFPVYTNFFESFLGGKTGKTIYLDPTSLASLSQVSQHEQTRALDVLEKLFVGTDHIEKLLSPLTLGRFYGSNVSLADLFLRIRKNLWKSNRPTSDRLPSLAAHVHALGQLATTEFNNLTSRAISNNFRLHLDLKDNAPQLLKALYPWLEMEEGIKQAQAYSKKELHYLLKFTSTCDDTERKQIRSDLPDCVGMSSLHNRIHHILYGNESRFEYREFKLSSVSGSPVLLPQVANFWIVVLAVAVWYS